MHRCTARVKHNLIMLSRRNEEKTWGGNEKWGRRLRDLTVSSLHSAAAVAATDLIEICRARAGHRPFGANLGPRSRVGSAWQRRIIELPARPAARCCCRRTRTSNRDRATAGAAVSYARRLHYSMGWRLLVSGGRANVILQLFRWERKRLEKRATKRPCRRPLVRALLLLLFLRFFAAYSIPPAPPSAPRQSNRREREKKGTVTYICQTLSGR